MDNTIDPTVQALAKAIKKNETGVGDTYATTTGKDGEVGAYRFLPTTWSAWAGKHLKDPNAPLSVENQNRVAYGQIKEWKDQGLTPAQIASKWNSGDENAYKDPTHKGISKGGAPYDTPAYVSRVSADYEGFKPKAQPQAPQQATGGAVEGEQPKKDGFFKSLAKGLISPVATMVARPFQAGAALMGASSESIDKATKDIAGDWVAPTPKSAQDVVKDVGRAAETVALGMPVKGVMGAVKMGTVAGAGAGLEKEGTLQGAATGGLIGAGTGLAGGLISKAISAAPKWLAKDAFGLTDDQAAKVLSTKKLGSAKSLFSQSEKSVAQQSKVIQQIIREADKSGVKGLGNESLKRTLVDYPEYAGKTGIPKLLNKIKALIPSDSGIIERGQFIKTLDKFAKGKATLEEKNLIRMAIDNATVGGYAKLAKAMQPSAGHDLAMTLAGHLREEVKTLVPTSVPLFDELAKEMAIKKIFRQLAMKKPGALIRWADIVPYLAGSGFGGPVGGLLTTAVYRGAHSPIAEFTAAKAIQGVGKAVTPVTSRAGLLPELIK